MASIYIAWNSVAEAWELLPDDVAGLHGIDDHNNVDAATPDDGDVIIYNNGTGLWESTAPGTHVIGPTTEGSIRVVDSDTTGGAWTDDNGLQTEDVVFYDTLTAGTVSLLGIAALTDSSAGVTVNDNTVAWAVWEEFQDNHLSANTVGATLNRAAKKAALAAALSAAG